MVADVPLREVELVQAAVFQQQQHRGASMAKNLDKLPGSVMAAGIIWRPRPCSRLGDAQAGVGCSRTLCFNGEAH